MVWCGQYSAVIVASAGKPDISLLLISHIRNFATSVWGQWTSKHQLLPIHWQLSNDHCSTIWGMIARGHHKTKTTNLSASIVIVDVNSWSDGSVLALMPWSSVQLEQGCVQVLTSEQGSVVDVIITRRAWRNKYKRKRYMGVSFTIILDYFYIILN